MQLENTPQTWRSAEHVAQRLGRAVADLRKSYERATLNEADAAASPFVQFEQWLNEALAAQVPEPTAMTLATAAVAADGSVRPSSRVVLLKGFDAQGLVWYTHYTSRKGQELAAQPHAALQFHWVELERVVRIEGRVEQVSPAESDAYFASRPRGSQLGAWASAQSSVVAGRSELEANLAQLQAQYESPAASSDPAPNPIPRLATWGGYRLVPEYFEFWQGRRNRLHDRLVYTPQGGQWLKSRLAP